MQVNSAALVVEAAVDRPLRPPDPLLMPNGEYDGIWSGMVVHVHRGNWRWVLHTDKRLPAHAAPCCVRVADGKVTVTAEFDTGR